MTNANLPAVRLWSIRAMNEIRKLVKVRTETDEHILPMAFTTITASGSDSAFSVLAMEQLVTKLLTPGAQLTKSEQTDLIHQLWAVHDYMEDREIDARELIEGATGSFTAGQWDRANARLKLFRNAREKLFRLIVNTEASMSGAKAPYPGGFISLPMAAGLAAGIGALWWWSR